MVGNGYLVAELEKASPTSQAGSNFFLQIFLIFFFFSSSANLVSLCMKIRDKTLKIPAAHPVNEAHHVNIKSISCKYDVTPVKRKNKK